MFKLVFTSYWDAVGTPALVVPMGFTATGLPLSLQIAGRAFDERIESLLSKHGIDYVRGYLDGLKDATF